MILDTQRLRLRRETTAAGRFVLRLHWHVEIDNARRRRVLQLTQRLRLRCTLRLLSTEPDAAAAALLSGAGTNESRAPDEIYESAEAVQWPCLKEAVPLFRALEMAHFLLSAVAEAHRAHLVLNDLSPSNLIIGERQVWIVDLSQASAPIGDDSLPIGMSPDDAKIDAEYAAPERAGRAVLADMRSDIYSCGVLIYELLAGELPPLCSPQSARLPSEPPSYTHVWLRRSRCGTKKKGRVPFPAKDGRASQAAYGHIALPPAPLTNVPKLLWRVIEKVLPSAHRARVAEAPARAGAGEAA